MILATVGCNKPDSLGADFIDDDEVQVKERSDFEFLTKTIVREPEVVFTASGLTIPNTFLLGHLDDPFLGISNAEIYSQYDFASRKTNPFEDCTIDSIVLSLKYDTFGVYGNIEEEVTLHVYELKEHLTVGDEYTSNQQFMVSAMPLASKTFVPKPYDPYVVTDTSGMMDSLDAQIRILLDPNDPNVMDLHQRLQESDTIFWANRDTFLQEVFNGIYLRLDANNTMLGFDFQDLTDSRLRVYYTPDTSDQQSTYSLFLHDEVVKTAYYNHEYQDLAEQILSDSNATPSDTLMFLQEMQGLSPEITITGLDSLEGTLINLAALEITVARLPGDDADMYSKPILLTGEQYTDSSRVDVIDTRRAKAAADAAGSTSFYTASFGGNCEDVDNNGEDLQVYTVNITSYLQEKIDAGENEAVLILSSLLQPESPRRVLFYGAESKHPVKLSVIYTDL